MEFNNGQLQQSQNSPGNHENQEVWFNEPEFQSQKSLVRQIIWEKLSTGPLARIFPDPVYRENLIGYVESALLERAESKEEYMNKETLDDVFEKLLSHVLVNSSSVDSSHPRSSSLPRSRSEYAGQMISHPYTNARHNNCFVSSNVEALTTSQQQLSRYSQRQMGFMERSGMCQGSPFAENLNGSSHSTYLSMSQTRDVEPIMQQSVPDMRYSHPLRNNQDGFHLNSQSMQHCNTYSCMTASPALAQLVQPQQNLQMLCHMQQKNFQSHMQFGFTNEQNINMSNYHSLVQDKAQWDHHPSERFYRESECVYCQQFPYLLYCFGNMTCTSFREKYPQLCNKLDYLTWHLRNCNDCGCGCNKYRIIYQHFLACHRDAYEELVASQNCVSGSLNSNNRSVQRTCDYGETGQHTEMKTQKTEHSPSRRSSFVGEQCHSKDELLQHVIQQYVSPVSVETKVTDSNRESFVDPTRDQGDLNEIKNDYSLFQEICEIQEPSVDHVEGITSEMLQIESVPVIE